MTTTELTGLELMKLTATTDDHRAPIATLMGVSIDAVDYGRVTMSIQTRPDFANPMGTVHGGICATLLDAVMSAQCTRRWRPALATAPSS